MGQKQGGKPAIASSVLAPSKTVRFILSATPFVWGRYGVARPWVTPKSRNALINSGELSDHTYDNRRRGPAKSTKLA
jgi:hypothetical protein